MSSQPNDIDGFKSHIDPVTIIRQYVELRKSGSQWVGRCPFHDDSSPSFYVNEKGFRCFGCDARGDAIRFVQDIEGIKFVDAYTRLRVEAGFSPGEARPQIRERIERSNKDPLPPEDTKPISKIVAEYDYTDERGNLLFQVVRMDPKSFRQRRPDPAQPGKWIWKLRENGKDLVRHVLFRLPRVASASVVLLACGEKDVLTLESLNFVATTNPGGEGKWREAYSDSLRGKEVYLFPDNDDAGFKHAEKLKADLAGVAKAFYVVPIQVGKDVTNWVEGGADRFVIEQAMEEARKLEPESFACEARFDTKDKIQANDIGRTIIEEHDLMANEEGYVYEYNGKHWEWIQPSRLEAYANKLDCHEKTSRRRRSEAASYVIVNVHRTKIHWRNLKPYEIPVLNGVANVETGDVRPHRKEDYLETVIPHRWPGRQNCPNWLAALDLYFSQDDEQSRTEKILAIQEFFGYCLMPHARYKKALFLKGESNTGKSVFPFVLRKLVGETSTCSVSVEDMDDERKRVPLIGKAVNVLSELTTRAVMADGGFKTLVSTEEALIFDPKYAQPIHYAPIAKHVICTNNLPRIRDTSDGVYNRLLLIEFNHVIPADQQDANFSDKIAPEMEAILYWAMVGASRLYANKGKFTIVQSSVAAIKQYKEDQNPVIAFIAEKYDRWTPEDGGAETDWYESRESFRKAISEWSDMKIGHTYLASLLRSAGLTHGTNNKRGSLHKYPVIFGIKPKSFV